MKSLKQLCFLGFALLLACQSSDKAAELEAKEQQLAAREQQLKEEALAAREQAVALREQAAARAAAPASATPSAAVETPQPPPAASAQTARTATSPTPEPSAAPAVPLVPHKVPLTVAVTVDMVKPGGQQWDGLGDAPDPLITATVQRSGQTVTNLTKNSLSATASLQLDLQPGDTVSINVVDKDLSAHDPIGSFNAMYLGAPMAQQGKLGAGSITVTFGG